MMMFPYDYTMIILIPGIMLAMWAQLKVKSSFARYSEVYAGRGVTAERVARTLLDGFGLQNVKIERVSGQLTDHYDPRAKILRLSDSVSGSSSIAAIGIAAHEVGHAVQDKKGYAPLRIRNSIVPVASIGSSAALPLFFLGLIMGSTQMLNIGIALFIGVVIFHLVTLPVEFDASSRALKLLSNTGTLDSRELAGARKVLNAAAWTYVAATLVAVLHLLRFIMIAQGRRD